jgi:hypothetical protein
LDTYVQAVTDERRQAQNKLVKAWECFDAESRKDLGVELREYYIPDFSKLKKQWKIVALARAIDEGVSTDSVSREEVFAILESAQ